MSILFYICALCLVIVIYLDCVSEYFNIETQSPRQFFDSRDKGLHITYWDVKAGEKVPNVPLLYSFEVNNLHYIMIESVLFDVSRDITKLYPINK